MKISMQDMRAVGVRDQSITRVQGDDARSAATCPIHRSLLNGLGSHISQDSNPKLIRLVRVQPLYCTNLWNVSKPIKGGNEYTDAIPVMQTALRLRVCGRTFF